MATGGAILVTGETRPKWTEWPVNWSAVWVGVLAAVAAVLLFGLIGAAIGAQVAIDGRLVDLKKIGLGALAFAVFSAFLAFVIGGWAAGKVAGTTHSEPAMLHGAISWLTALPALVLLGGLGAGSYLGAWHGGVAGRPSWAAPVDAPGRPDAPDASASEAERARYRHETRVYRERVAEEAPRVARNAALGTLTALLLGLMGAVVGGWMASGEPMSLTYRREDSLNNEQMRV